MARRGNPQNILGSNPEEARAIARKGGVKSGEVRRRKSCFRECVKHYIGAKSDVDPKLTNLEVMVKAMIAKAIAERDVRAFDSLRDTAGEKPATMLDVKGALAQDVKVDLSGLPREQVDRLVDRAFDIGENE